MEPEYPKNTEELLQDIEAEWSALRKVVEKLSPEQMIRPDAGGWSPKDNLAHLAHWERFMLLLDPATRGEVLVLNDILGLDESFKPKFVKRFGAVGQAVSAAVGEYVREVREQTFPAEEHSFHAPSLRLLHAVEEDPRDDAQVVGAPV